MVAPSDVKFYKSAGGGLGGAINTAAEITTNQSDNSFPDVTRAEQITGKDYYLCIYIKNTHATEEMKAVSFWITQQSGGQEHDTETKWAKDAAGLNGTAQTIANINTVPTSVSWLGLSSSEPAVNIGLLKAGEYYPIWIWRHIDADAASRRDDGPLFDFAFNISGSGSGTGGGGGTGTGGTPTLDDFDIIKIYPTKSGGRVYNSNWAAASTTTHTITGNSGQIPDTSRDPQDLLVDFNAPSTCIATIDAANDWLLADTNTDQNSWRYYVNDPQHSWKWDPSIESTIYYRALNDQAAGTIHVHCRLMGPTEHWKAIAICASAGHEYSFEIKPASSTIELRKELAHPDYAENQISTVAAAPYNVWIGMKLTTQKMANGNMKVQGWRDTTDGLNGGTWIKVIERIDAGDWAFDAGNSAELADFGNVADGTGDCKKVASSTAILNFPAGAIGLRCDNTKVQFKKFSVREIDPLDSGGNTGGGGGDPTGGTGGNPPPVNANWKIAITGDEGCTSTTDKVVNMCKAYDYTISVGDHAYAAAACWTGKFGVLKPKFNSAYGNHEYSESGGIAPYKTFFGHSKTYFSFNFQNVHVLILDSNATKVPLASGSAQHNFATSDLTAADTNPDIDWIFVIMHHPWWAPGAHHPSNEFNQVQAYHSLFMSHKVALVMCGHNHNWQRTHQVAYNAGNPDAPTIADSSSPYVKSSAGLIHVVSGTSGTDTGSSLYSLGSQPSFQAYQNRTNNGIFEIVASNNGQTLNCAFVNTDGNKFDPFIITSS